MRLLRTASYLKFIHSILKSLFVIFPVIVYLILSIPLFNHLLFLISFGILNLVIIFHEKQTLTQYFFQRIDVCELALIY